MTWYLFPLGNAPCSPMVRELLLFHFEMHRNQGLQQLQKGLTTSQIRTEWRLRHSLQKWPDLYPYYPFLWSLRWLKLLHRILHVDILCNTYTKRKGSCKHHCSLTSVLETQCCFMTSKRFFVYETISYTVIMDNLVHLKQQKWALIDYPRISAYELIVFFVCFFKGPQYNRQSCIALNVLRLVELKYCRGNGLFWKPYLSWTEIQPSELLPKANPDTILPWHLFFQVFCSSWFRCWNRSFVD